MANPVCEVFLSKNPIPSPPTSFPLDTGGVVDFWGVVRETEDGVDISGIEYEAHEAMAHHQLRTIAENAGKRFDLRTITVRHRLGKVAAGEASLFLRVGSRHRAEAFRAAGWIVDELKKRAPIWKHPKSGSAE